MIRAWLLSLSIVAAAGLAAHSAVFTPLGDLPGGAFESAAQRISADGSTIVGWSTSAAGREAFRWTLEGGMVGLGHLPHGSQDSIAYGVSGDGSLIAGFSDNKSNNGLQAEAFYWTAAEGMKSLGFLPGGTESRARAVSADGSTIVGWSRTSGGIEAFRWNHANKTMTSLGDLDGGIVAGTAQNVSANGTYIVGYGTTENGRQPVQWKIGQISRLGISEFDSAEGIAFEVNPDGSAIGYVSFGTGRQAAIFGTNDDDPSYEPLGELAGGEDDSAAFGIIPRHSQFSQPYYVVGASHTGTSDTETGYEAFIWADWFQMRSFKEIAETNFGLDLSGWTLETAVSAAQPFRNDISSLKNAVFTGVGIDPQGNTQAWMIDFGRTQTATIDSAPGWLEAPRGVFDFASQSNFGITKDAAPLNADLWSPPFTIPQGATPEVRFSYEWTIIDSGNGDLSVELVADDDPTKSIGFLPDAEFPSELTQYRQPIPTQGVNPSKKYRLRFRYKDQDEQNLSLGPLTLQDIAIEGVDFNVSVAGDTNGDGKVDLVDLNNVRNNFGGAGLGDTNGDSIIDLEDLNAVRNNFGDGGAGAVPEPGTLALSGLGGALLCAAGRARRTMRKH